MKSGSLNLLEPSGPHRACYGTAFYLMGKIGPIGELRVMIKKSLATPLQVPKSLSTPLQVPKSLATPLQVPKSLATPLQVPKMFIHVGKIIFGPC
jgi:hypothetical protein